MYVAVDIRVIDVHVLSFYWMLSMGKVALRDGKQYKNNGNSGGNWDLVKVKYYGVFSNPQIL